MIFDIITIFPDFFSSILEYGLLKRACAGGQVTIRIHDLRDFTDDRHHTVDDRPFGGGPGMLFKPEPVFRAVEALNAQPDTSVPRRESLEPVGPRPENTRVILLSPQGRLFSQAVAEELALESRLILICGRYEGVDERVAEHLATDELSIGDYVLSGGELPAAVVMESVTRLLPGVLGNEESRQQESFAAGGDAAGSHQAFAHTRGYPRGLETSELDKEATIQCGPLDCPHYTRPADFRGMRVPEILLSGNHQEIREWRHRQALLKTWRKRPDLLVNLSKNDVRLLEEIKRSACEPAPTTA